MTNIETLADFYQCKLDWLPEGIQQGMGHFNIFRLEDFASPNVKPIKYIRRNFYKIALIRGTNLYHYADKSLQISGTTLIFFNPRVPYTWEPLSDDGERTGYSCIFTESFFPGGVTAVLGRLPMFQIGGNPAYTLNKQQDKYVNSLFEKMKAEIDADYIYKYDLIRNYITEVAHYALKTQPSETQYQHPNANSRICAVFTELLERQFPIEDPAQRFALRSAKDFAQQMAVHVNHLNRAVRETTGRTTTDQIAERLLSEARVLLRHTDWNVSEIAYCLGFEEATHFNNFFKKHTSTTPTGYRVV